MDESNESLFRQKGISKLVKIVKDDRRELFLLPDESKGEIGVCNPSEYDSNLIYRVREKCGENGSGERSVLKKDGEIILFPEYDFEKDGIEDARLSKDGRTYLITYVGYNENLENSGPKIALATTRNFKKNEINKYGIIGPQIRFEEAIGLVGANSYYGKCWSKELEAIRNTQSKINPFIPDKDAALEYMPSIGKWALWHRLEPAIQIAYADKISDFKDQYFWEKQIEKLEENTILRPGGYWAIEKIGLGGLPINIDGRKIGHIHGVERKEGKDLTKYFYRGTFVEFDSKTNRVIAAIREPMLVPKEEDALFEFSRDGRKIEKYVNFPTVLRIDPDDSEALLSISGWGDRKIGIRTHNKKYILDELSHPYNAIENWDCDSVVK